MSKPTVITIGRQLVSGGREIGQVIAKKLGISFYDKELLAEAGYADGLDIGTILTINGSYWEKMSTVFQSNLADIGVTVGVELADSAACRVRRKDHDYNLATTGTNYSPDASYSYQYFRYLTPEQKAEGVYS